MEKISKEAKGFGFKIGDILVAGWGYEAEIFDFYEVVGLTKTMVKVRELKKTCVDGVSDYAMYYGRLVKPVMAGGDRFASNVIMRKPFNYSRDLNYRYSGIAVTSYKYAYPWDGEPCDEYNAH